MLLLEFHCMEYLCWNITVSTVFVVFNSHYCDCHVCIVTICTAPCYFGMPLFGLHLLYCNVTILTGLYYITIVWNTFVLLEFYYYLCYLCSIRMPLYHVLGLSLFCVLSTFVLLEFYYYLCYLCSIRMPLYHVLGLSLFCVLSTFVVLEFLF